MATMNHKDAGVVWAGAGAPEQSPALRSDGLLRFISSFLTHLYVHLNSIIIDFYSLLSLKSCKT